jgi:hypothetical protein
MKPLSLWTGIVAGPLIWLVYLEASYALTPSACIAGNKQILGASTLAALLAIALTVWVAWRSWRASGATTATEAGNPATRSRFMALAGLGLSALSFLVVLASAIPIVVLGACD